MAINGYFQKDKVKTKPRKQNFRAISEGLDMVAGKIPIMPDEISIDNFDEVKLHFKTELAIAVKKIESALKGVKPLKKIEVSNFPPKLEKVQVEDLQSVTSAIQELYSLMSGVEFNPTINVASPDVIIPEIVIPESKTPIVNVPTPKVTVSPIVDIDIKQLLKALKPLQLITDEPTKPISVRVSDGENFVKAVKQAAGQMVQAYNATNYLTQDELRDTVITSNDRFANYHPTDIDKDASPNYYGFVTFTGAWYIMREVLDPGKDTYRYTAGKESYTDNWTSRTTLTYSYIYEVSI